MAIQSEVYQKVFKCQVLSLWKLINKLRVGHQRCRDEMFILEILTSNFLILFSTLKFHFTSYRLRCQYCMHSYDGSDLSLDHVLPRSRGGKLTWLNTVTACKACNFKKGKYSLDELDRVGMKLRNLPRVSFISVFMNIYYTHTHTHTNKKKTHTLKCKNYFIN